MALSEASVAQRAYAALVAAGADPAAIKIPNLIALIADALELVAKDVAAGPDYQGLQKDFQATPAAGVLDLTALSGILYDHARSRVRVNASGDELSPVDDLLTLQNGNLPADQVWYAQEGGTLRFRSTTPSMTDYVTTVKIMANHVPALADWPTQYEAAVIAKVVELAQRQTAGITAKEAAETGRA